MRISTLSKGDAGTVSRFLRKITEKALRHVCEHGLPGLEREVRAIVEYLHYSCFLAGIPGLMNGVILAVTRGNVARIFGPVVKEDGGTGESLLRCALSYLRDVGAKGAMCVVIPEVTWGQRFYAKKGFSFSDSLVLLELKELEKAVGPVPIKSGEEACFEKDEGFCGYRRSDILSSMGVRCFLSPKGYGMLREEDGYAVLGPAGSEDLGDLEALVRGICRKVRGKVYCYAFASRGDVITALMRVGFEVIYQMPCMTKGERRLARFYVPAGLCLL